jgi:hypothetical protein
MSRPRKPLWFYHPNVFVFKTVNYKASVYILMTLTPPDAWDTVSATWHCIKKTWMSSNMAFVARHNKMNINFYSKHEITSSEHHELFYCCLPGDWWWCRVVACRSLAALRLCFGKRQVSGVLLTFVFPFLLADINCLSVGTFSLAHNMEKKLTIRNSNA